MTSAITTPKTTPLSVVVEKNGSKPNKPNMAWCTVCVCTLGGSIPRHVTSISAGGLGNLRADVAMSLSVFRMYKKAMQMGFQIRANGDRDYPLQVFKPL